ncbi:hypothetical protein MKW92_024660 [Papaver armeniacum]|nr:hypothetical protein MKW92_024660 [Papaver armeniacum]
MKRTSPRREYCVEYVKDVQQTPKLYNEFLQLIEKFKDLPRLDANTVEFHLKYTVLSERIKQIFKRHSELLSKFKPFLPDGYEDTVAVDHQADGHDDDEAAVVLHEEYSFFENVKASLRSPDEYKQFLKCLYVYSMERISKDELQALTGFTYSENEDIRRRTTTKSTENRSNNNGGERDKRPGSEASTSKRRKLIEEPKSMVARLLDSKDVNPSYKRSTRKNNQICLFASGISTEPGDDEVPHYEPKKNTETSSEYFKHSIYEENLFKCEDERVERDILSSTIERAEELVEKIDDNCSHEDHFSVPQLGCIKRLFGKLGQDVMESFGDNAILVLPLISTRLHQKLQEVSASLLNSENELKLVSSGNSRLMLHNTTSSRTKDDAYTSWPNPLAELIV